MKKRTLSAAFWAVFLLFSLKNEKAEACGFGFWTPCGSRAWVSIDGTTDSLAVAPCVWGFQLGGLDLGAVWSFRLDRIRAQTWESCTNRVYDCDFFYRVFEEGQAAPAFSALGFATDSMTVEGPYTTRHRSLAPNLELLTGLAVGKNYVFEFFVRAQVDTTADGAVDHAFFANAGGEIQRVRFRKSTALADPFTVVLKQKTDNPCHGDSVGVASVFAYGLGQPFQYNWENDYHFYAQYTLPADDWSITVVNQNGREKAMTVAIGQPPEQKRAFEKAICAGQTFLFEGFEYDQPGHFLFRKAAPNGCDSLIEFELKILDPAADLTGLPDSILLDCAAPSAEICAPPGATGSFVWASATETLSTANCATVAGIDGLFVTAFEPAGATFCSANHFIKVVADTSRPSILIEKSPKCDGTALILADTDATASLAFSFSTSGLPPFLASVGQHSATATGANGCTATAFFEVFEAIKFELESSPATDGQADGAAFLKSLEGGKGQFQILWSNGATDAANLGLAGPAFYAATATDAEGCAATDSVFVDAVLAAGDGFFESEKWQLAPVPAFEFLEIEAAQLVDNERVVFKIASSDGRIFQRLEPVFFDQKARIDIGFLLPGVHFLIVEKGGKRSGRGFLKY